MNRRSFLARLLGLPAVPLAAKAVPDEPEPVRFTKLGVPGEDTLLIFDSDTGQAIPLGGTHERRTYQFFSDFIDQTGPAYMTSFDDLTVAALPPKKTP